MDSFEVLVGSILRNQGFWVEESLKVELTKPEKVEIQRATSPRWKLDVVAYKAGSGDLLVIECKSFLDSRGVTAASVIGETDNTQYKLFREPKLREVVFRRLEKQLIERGSIAPNPKITLCLATGRIATNKDRARLHEYFEAKGWKLFDEEWVRKSLDQISEGSYQNSVASVVAKILIRGRKT